MGNNTKAGTRVLNQGCLESVGALESLLLQPKKTDEVVWVSGKGIVALLHWEEDSGQIHNSLET